MVSAPDNKIRYLVGQGDGVLCVRPLVPYDELACEFLSSLSAALLSDKEARPYSDVISFAYWCRKANLARLKGEFGETHTRLGLGMAFHITPSNVPINFAFSYAFSLLAGNANIVRVPTIDSPQTTLVCRVINQLLADKKYEKIAERTAFVKYAQNDNITEAFSSECNARIIWGGDDTIKRIRKLALPVRSIEVAFADRYSLSVIDGSAIIRSTDVEMQKLANGFYNDAYLMDQNACSSPHLLVWLNGGEELAKAKQRFWDCVYEIVISKYELQPAKAVDKYMLLCWNAIELENISGFTKHGNYLYRIELDSLPVDMDSLRGKCGFFYEYNTQNINNIAHIINTKYQTMTYYGLDKAQLLDFIIANRLSGIDRIVPIGSALDIGTIWDGYDIVRTLSRKIDVK